MVEQPMENGTSVDFMRRPAQCFMRAPKAGWVMKAPYGDRPERGMGHPAQAVILQEQGINGHAGQRRQVWIVCDPAFGLPPSVPALYRMDVPTFRALVLDCSILGRSGDRVEPDLNPLASVRTPGSKHHHTAKRLNAILHVEDGTASQPMGRRMARVVGLSGCSLWPSAQECRSHHPKGDENDQ